MHVAHYRSLAVVLALGVGSCGERESGAHSERAEGGVARSEAERLMRGAHFLTTLPRREASGRLRKEGAALLIGVVRRDREVEVKYQDVEEGGAVRVHARVGEERLEVFEMVGGEAWPCSAGRLGEEIAGTDFTREDLLMPWLLWPGGEVRGLEEVEGRAAWRLRVTNPERDGQTREVELWIDRKTGGLARAVAMDGEGRVLKRFRVLGRQGGPAGAPTLRKVCLDRLDPATRDVVGSSSLEFDPPRLVGALE